MQNLPFRTSSTWLSEDDLILLDVIFCWMVPGRLLSRRFFLEQWNLGYSHNLSDEELECRLRELCEIGVLETKNCQNCIYYQMTRFGGELWSKERCPVWERFCMERGGRPMSEGRELMSVVAVSPQIRDDFLRIQPMYPARRRTATIKNYEFVPWHKFDQLYVGVATYVEQHEWTYEESIVHDELYRKHQTLLQCERSWWQCVSELQRFIPNASNNTVNPSED